MAQGEENLKRITEDGKVVAVLEKRAVDARREGYFVIQVSQKLYGRRCELVTSPISMASGNSRDAASVPC